MLVDGTSAQILSAKETFAWTLGALFCGVQISVLVRDYVLAKLKVWYSMKREEVCVHRVCVAVLIEQLANSEICQKGCF